MRLRTATTFCLAAAALASGAFAHAEVAKPTHGVYVAKCNKVTRAAAFVGTMRAVKGTDHMSMRFTLLERLLPSTEYQEVAAPEFDVWRRSRSGVKKFSYRQRVRALAEAAHYKMAVEFRWHDDESRVLRRASSRSRRCRQPGKLPNLRVSNIVYRAARDGYLVRVENVGRDVATGASIQLFVDGKGDDGGVAQLPEIPAGESRTVFITGASCSGFVQAVADPTLVVRESSENDNTRVDSCAELRIR
jgi:CARDB